MNQGDDSDTGPIGNQNQWKKAENVARNLGFDSFFIKDAVGFSRGIWILWFKNLTNIHIIEENYQYVHTKIFWLSSRVEKFFTFIYGSRRRAERRFLWDSLKRFAVNGGGKWAAMGDFNAYLEAGEKHGGAGACWDSMKDIDDCLSASGLSDLGFSGLKFNWRRGTLRERIDRIVVNEEWHRSFPDRYMVHLQFYGSDHRPIVLKDGNGCRNTDGPKPFRFLAAWLTNTSFREVVENCWSKEAEWIPAKNKFHKEATSWHQDRFKEDQKKKFQIQRRLRGVDNQLNRGPNEAIERLHRELWNSRFFHAATVSKNRRNKVTTLKKEDGVWVDDPEELKLMAINFFKNMYVEENQCISKLCIGNRFPVIDNDSWRKIGRCQKNDEEKSIIYKMHPYKASGVDGLHAIFIQSQWDSVGSSVMNLIREIFEDPKRVASINQTLICLIPKVENPEMISQFRPISLCNIVYKVITKVIASRLKNHISSLIMSNQCSFVKGRHASDNIIISQEIFHSMRTKKG
ncbi:uncharacterized protein LOC133304941 [Gastrolobium bilobum]|uniref:uncharacterized protein LOC133304941 n=1 Tax=Gastrolobium bilobum TaxID=150636 RepID=UPI002AB13844|nr:uncharacterized protein LOC133304941 [Gastrolobium bilobum]